jgi:aspartate/methionine/tyrosine aminotransferase
MNEIAKEMNSVLGKKSPVLFSLLSDFGKKIYMPKGIIVQSAEAKSHAYECNATIGIAKEKGGPMYLASVSKFFNGLTPSEIFPYATPYGLPELRKLWQEKIISENNLKDKKISLPVVTHALTHGLMLTGDLFIDEDDEIYLPDKLWENYEMIYPLRYKAKFVTYDFFDSSLKGFNVTALEKTLEKSKKKKIVLLFNFPNNPTGYTPTREEADAIRDVVLDAAKKGKKLLVLVDDAYYGLSFEDGLLEGSIFSKFAGLHPNIVAVKMDGFTKEFYVWGFRLGFVTFADYHQDREVYEVMEKKTAGAIRCSISNCSLPAQSIALKLLTEGGYREEKEEKYKILRSRAEKVKEIVYDRKFSELWDVYPFNSGYFMCLRLKDVDSNRLREYALKKYGIGTISTDKRDLRIAFSSVETDKIEKLFDLLARSVRELKG